mmetsp:Transcript_31334/g.93297  ORF Transcript_31334/g.93297 Transcript_31334/m.93297 type:complete len:384 (+) Transcript_31334:351-1502(+)
MRALAEAARAKVLNSSINPAINTGGVLVDRRYLSPCAATRSQRSASGALACRGRGVPVAAEVTDTEPTAPLAPLRGPGAGAGSGRRLWLCLACEKLDGAVVRGCPSRAAGVCRASLAGQGQGGIEAPSLEGLDDGGALQAGSLRSGEVALLALGHPAVGDPGMAGQEGRHGPAEGLGVTARAVAVAVVTAVVAAAVLVWVGVPVAACRRWKEAVHPAQKRPRVLPQRLQHGVVAAHVQGIALEVGTELAVDLHGEHAVHVVAAVDAALALRVQGALPGDVLLAEPVADVTRRVTRVLVADAGNIRGRQAVDRHIAWSASIPTCAVVESAPVIAEVFADISRAPGEVARRSHRCRAASGDGGRRECREAQGRAHGAARGEGPGP